MSFSADPNYLDGKNDILEDIINSAIFSEQFVTIFTTKNTLQTRNAKILINKEHINCIKNKLIY